jgi:hypothetical protein
MIVRAAVLGLCVAACSSEKASPAAAADVGVEVGDVGAESIEACSTPSEIPGAECVLSVAGKVVDTTGAPVVGKTVSVCGTTCFFGKTDQTGAYDTFVGSLIRVADYAVVVHGGPEVASMYVKLPSAEDRRIAFEAPLVLPRMPATGPRLPFDDQWMIDAAGSVTVGPENEVTLAFEAGTKVELDIEDVALGEKGEQVRFVKVDPKDYPPFAKEAGLSLLYAATPFGSTYSKKLTVTIDKTGLPDGEVELVAVGKEFVQLPATAGTPQVVAKGKVAGGKLATDPGEGLSYLTWLGARAKR